MPGTARLLLFRMRSRQEGSRLVRRRQVDHLGVGVRIVLGSLSRRIAADGRALFVAVRRLVRLGSGVPAGLSGRLLLREVGIQTRRLRRPVGALSSNVSRDRNSVSTRNEVQLRVLQQVRRA